MDEETNDIVYITMSEEHVDTVYITLPGHPEKGEAGCVKEMIRLDTILKDYQTPMINLDFDKNKKLIGIEILV